MKKKMKYAQQNQFIYKIKFVQQEHWKIQKEKKAHNHLHHLQFKNLTKVALLILSKIISN